jgi:hypothetical protein
MKANWLITSSLFQETCGAKKISGSEDRFSNDLVINREHAKKNKSKIGAKSLVLVVPALIPNRQLSPRKIRRFLYKSLETRHL